MRQMVCTGGMISLLIIAASCGQEPGIPAEELQEIVERDGVPFSSQSIPEEILDRLAAHEIVLAGETHFLREHRQLVVELLRQLHARGFRQLLFEWTQAADWLMEDYVLDGGMEPSWAPPEDIGGDMFAAIREFNRGLKDTEKIHVRPIDVTLQDYGGADSFLWSLGRLVLHLPTPGPVAEFLQGDYDTPEHQTALLTALLAELDSSRSDLIMAWGAHWYEVIVDLAEVELESVSIRAIRNRDYDKSVRLREDAIKRLAERRVQDSPFRTMINFGSTHAQKERLWGTEIEWLGDYLAHKSQAVDGSLIVLNISAAKILSVPGSGVSDWDLRASPSNELYRVMNTFWPDQIVFLPADDPVFSNRKVLLNVAGDIHVGLLKRHFDAFVLLPLAHRIPHD